MDRPGVFIKLPEGFQEYDVGGTEMVGELLKALHGLKQAPLLWNTEFTEHMKSIGYCTPHLKQMLAFSSNSSFTLTISFTFMPIARALMP